MFSNSAPLFPPPEWAEPWEWVLWGVLTAVGVTLGGWAVTRLNRRRAAWLVLAGLVLLFLGWVVACRVWVRGMEADMKARESERRLWEQRPRASTVDTNRD